MKYTGWIWRNTQGIRWNTAVRIVTGTAQVAMGLLMVWLSRRFIDETIHTGSARDVTVMIIWLVLTVVGGVLLRQVYFLLTTKASIRQTNAIVCACSADCSAASFTTRKRYTRVT